jgi:hypothetical protein
MAKINVSRIGVFEIEYKGKNEPTKLLETGYRYHAIIIDGFSDDSIETQIHFIGSKHISKIIYEGVIGFSKDWEIIKENTLDKEYKPYLPIKSGSDY